MTEPNAVSGMLPKDPATVAWGSAIAFAAIMLAQSVGLDATTISGKAGAAEARLAVIERRIEEHHDRISNMWSNQTEIRQLVSQEIGELTDRVQAAERAGDAVTYRMEEQRNSTGQLTRAVETMSAEFRTLVQTVAVLDERIRKLTTAADIGGPR